MGSKLAPTLAMFAMNVIESKFDRAPLYYRRYVDDVFAIFKNEDEASIFLKYLNTHHKNIQFTMDTENGKKLNLLDVIVHKLDDGFGTEWAVKPTNTGVYTQKEAFSGTKLLP